MRPNTYPVTPCQTIQDSLEEKKKGFSSASDISKSDNKNISKKRCDTLT